MIKTVTNYFKQIPHDTFDGFENENLLSKKITEGLKIINPKIAKFHITSKVPIIFNL